MLHLIYLKTSIVYIICVLIFNSRTMLQVSADIKSADRPRLTKKLFVQQADYSRTNLGIWALLKVHFALRK